MKRSYSHGVLCLVLCFFGACSIYTVKGDCFDEDETLCQTKQARGDIQKEAKEDKQENEKNVSCDPRKLGFEFHKERGCIRSTSGKQGAFLTLEQCFEKYVPVICGLYVPGYNYDQELDRCYVANTCRESGFYQTFEACEKEHHPTICEPKAK